MAKRKAKIQADPNTREAYKKLSVITGSTDLTVIVYMAERSSERVAIKAIKVAGDVTLPNLDPSLSHPNLLTVSNLFRTENDYVWAVMPFSSGGSLRSITPLSERCIAAVLKRVLSAVAYLHGRGISHGDIKPGNIIVGLKSPVIKLADFGVSESFYNVGDRNSYDRLYWKAPESGAKESDVWALGVTAMELARGGPPISPAWFPFMSDSLQSRIGKRFDWSIKECEEQERYVKNGIWLDNNNFSEAFRDMVASCLDRDPSKRPSAEGLLCHRFFSENQDSDSWIRTTLAENNRDRGFIIGLGAGRSVRHVRVVSWGFDRERFELEPAFELWDTEEWENFLRKRIDLVSTRWQTMTSMIRGLRSDGNEPSREEELVEAIDELTIELDFEARRRINLKGESESLKAQLLLMMSSSNEN